MVHAIRTAEELERAGDIGRCELIAGELVMMMPPGGRHGELSLRVGQLLGVFVRKKHLGTVVGEVGFILARDPDTVRAPDAAFLRGPPGLEDGFLEGAPDLAIEVVSPTDRPVAVADKVAEWLEAGARAVWVIDPRARTVAVHLPEESPVVLGELDTLRGEPVVPGFRLPLLDLFH